MHPQSLYDAALVEQRLDARARDRAHRAALDRRERRVRPVRPRLLARALRPRHADHPATPRPADVPAGEHVLCA